MTRTGRPYSETSSVKSKDISFRGDPPGVLAGPAGLPGIPGMGDRPVALLDRDIVRKHLPSELGLFKSDREINIRRIGFVASEITKNGGIAVCAPVAPYESVRDEVRAMIEPIVGFVLVYVSTPLDSRRAERQ